MSTVINLNKARKRKARGEAQSLADANRVRFGRTPAERERDEASRKASEQKLDAHRREISTTPDDA